MDVKQEDSVVCERVILPLLDFRLSISLCLHFVSLPSLDKSLLGEGSDFFLENQLDKNVGAVSFLGVLELVKFAALCLLFSEVSSLTS